MGKILTEKMKTPDVLPRNIDSEWLEAFRAATDEHGIKTELAEKVGSSSASISYLRAGQRAPWWLVVAVSHELRIPLPRCHFRPVEFRLLELIHQASDYLDDDMLEGLCRQLEKAVRAMIEVGGVPSRQAPVSPSQSSVIEFPNGKKTT